MSELDVAAARVWSEDFLAWAEQLAGTPATTFLSPAAEADFRARLLEPSGGDQALAPIPGDVLRRLADG